MTLPTSNEPQSQPSRVVNICRTATVLISWYFISSTIILITKWLFTYHFSFPLTVTAFSNTIATIWAFIVSRRSAWRPEPLTRRQFRDYILPIGIATALEIGFSNIALKLLTVSFSTILKGGSPIFTFFWGLLFRIEFFSTKLSFALIIIALGIGLASLGEGKGFALNGFILQLLATALGGLRWAMTQFLLRGSSTDAMPPLTATLYTSPATALCVLPFAAALEGSLIFDRVSELEKRELTLIILTMVFIASLVFVLLISEYWLVNVTSSLALSVAGVFKELLTIGGGVLFLSEHLTFLNVVGFIVCQLGIFSYMFLRYDPANHTPSPVPTSDPDEVVDTPLTNNSVIDLGTTIPVEPHHQKDPSLGTALPT